MESGNSYSIKSSGGTSSDMKSHVFSSGDSYRGCCGKSYSDTKSIMFPVKDYGLNGVETFGEGRVSYKTNVKPFDTPAQSYVSAEETARGSNSDLSHLLSSLPKMF